MDWISGLFFLSVLGYGIGLMALVPKLSAGKAVFCGACAMLFVAYYGVIICGLMAETAYLLMAGGLTALAAAIIHQFASPRSGLGKRLLSPTLLVMAVLFALAIPLCRGTVLTSHDDFSFWARSVKELYSFDTFYIHENATMYHTDYIPLLTALEYCVVRVFGWKEAYLGYVPFALVVSSMAALSECVERKWLKAPLMALLLYGFGACGFTPYLLRADGPMLAVFAAGLGCLMLRREDSLSGLLPTLCAAAVLTGFKIYSGLMFAAILAAALLVEWLRTDKAGRKALRRAFLISLGLIVLLQVSWSVRYHLASDPQAGLGALLSGNPRSAQLLGSFTAENMASFRELIGDTFAAYAQSNLPWVWLFLLLPAGLCLWLLPAQRRRVIRLLVWLLVMNVVYWIGLFASYLVQSETAAVAVNYLSTAAGPCLLCGLLLAALALDRAPTAASIALMCASLAGTVLLLSPVDWVQSYRASDEPNTGVRMASTFWQEEVAEELLPTDADKRVVVFDCSWDASEIRSPSMKTHVYGYYALPLRVASVYQLTYGDYSMLEEMADWNLQDDLLAGGYQLAAFRVEDDLYWEELCSLLDLDSELPSIGLYDITVDEDGLPVLHSRSDEEE